MPVYRFTAPDGQQYRVTAPDGTTEQQAFQHLMQSMQGGAGEPQATPPGPTPSPEAGAAPAASREPVDPLSVSGGAGEALASLVTGSVAAPVAGLAGLAAYVAKVAGANVDPASVVEGTQDALTYQPRTEQGQRALGIAAKPFELLAQGADKAGQAAADATGSPLVGAGVNTAIQSLPMLAGGLLKLRPGRIKPTLPRPAGAPGVLEAEGIPTTLAQRGNHTMASMARAADTMLGPSRFAERQGEAFNRAAITRTGNDLTRLSADSRVTPDVMSDVFKDISGRYDDLHARVPTKIDGQLNTEVSDLLHQMRLETGGDPRFEAMRSTMENLLVNKSQGGVIDGFAYKDTRDTLGRLARSQDPTTKHFAKELKRAMDDAFERSAAPEDAAAMRTVRNNFNAATKIQKAVRTNAEGFIPPTSLYNHTNVAGGEASGLLELSRAGKSVLRDRVSNSGTPTRGADVGKIVGALQHPGELAKVLAAVLGGRLINESPGLQKVGRAGSIAARDPAVVAGSVTVGADHSDEFFRLLQGRQ